MRTDLDITHIYKSDEEWDVDYKVLSNNIKMLKETISNCFLNVDDFFSFVKLRLDSENLTDKLFSYCKRQVDIDFSLEGYKKKMKTVLDLYGDLQVIGSTLENEIILNSEKVNDYLSSGRLDVYRRFLMEILRKKEHMLDEDEGKEKLFQYMSEMQEVKDQYQDILVNKRGSITVNTKDGEVVVNKDNIRELMLDQNQDNRRIFSLAYSKTYSSYDEEVSKLFSRKLSADILLSRFRKFDSLLEEKMFSYDLPSSLFRNLIISVNDNLDILHDYNGLRKKILGLDSFHSYDTSLSICGIPKMKIKLEDGISFIKKALSVFGEKYVSLIDRMFDEGWVDVYSKEKKVNRSYTSIAYFGVPYIITNYNGSINSLRNLAHEIGHSANTYYSKEANMSHNFSVSFFLTEVASKVNEMLLDEFMLKSSSDLDSKKYILYNSINSLINSIFNQVKLSEFEDTVVTRLSSGKEIDASYLNQLYFDLNKKYNGEDLITDDYVKYDWILVTHFILQESYYMYQYSIGACLALYIVNRILSGDEDFIQSYLRFLSLGDSVSIKESLEVLGIDLENEDFLQYGFTHLKKKVLEFKNLY